MADETEYLLKIVVVGDMDVGKTCLLMRYCNDTFQENYLTTIGVDFKMRTLERMGYRIRMQLWDTAGQERFRTIVSSFYRGAHGLVIVYDVTNLNSFDKVPSWIQEANMFGGTSCLGILIGNKTDLDWKRQVSTEKGQEMAKEFGMQFFETSAKDNTNVHRSFDNLADTIANKTRLQQGCLHPLNTGKGTIDIRSSEVVENYWGSCIGNWSSCSPY